MKNKETKYWIIVASKDHVKNGISESIAQAGHGKEAPLKRMQKGDFVIYYSGKKTLEGQEKCQEFTALGEVADDEIYQQTISENFKPFRKKVNFLETKDVSILPLIADLEFIKNKEKWGFNFRYGFFEIGEEDFKLIEKEMLK